MRIDLTPDSTPPPDCASPNQRENDAPPNRPGGDEHTPRVGPMRLLRLKQVMQQTGLGKTKHYELQKEGALPMRIQITSNSVGWIAEEVSA